MSKKNKSNKDNNRNCNINSEETNTAVTEDDSCPYIDRIDKTALILDDVNSIKNSLAELPLNPAEKQYIENNIKPLLEVLNDFSNISVNLAGAADQLSTSFITHPKKSKIKDTEALIYDINEECEDLYRIIKKRLKSIVKCC